MYRFRRFRRVSARLHSGQAPAHARGLWLITRRLFERLAAQNVRYAEIIFAAGVVLWKRQEFAPIFDAVQRGRRGIAGRGALDPGRRPPLRRRARARVAELAAERIDRGVVAFGIGGSEERGPAEWFAEVFAFARRAGLRLTAHAGESMGPESVWAALALGAERIGHGIAVDRDPKLARHLRERDIPLEICITSNLVTGVAVARSKSSRAPPIRRRRADHFEHGRPGHVQLLAHRRVPPGRARLRIQRGRDGQHRAKRFSATRSRSLQARPLP